MIMPSGLLSLLLSMLCLVCFCGDGQAYFSSDKTYVVPMQISQGHIWVDVLINGERTRAIVDTGCDTIAIPPSLAQRLNLSLSPSGKQLAMFDKQSKGFAAIVRDFRMGDLQLQNQQVDVVDYPYVIVGLPVLGKYGCTFDFDNNRLSLAPSLPNEPGGMQMEPFWGLYSVQGWLSNHPLKFIVDTGADTTIASRSSVAAIPRQVLSENAKHRLKYCRFQQIRIGNHAVNYPEMAVYDQPDTAGNTAVNTGAIMLGLPFWQHYNVTLDFPAQRMTLLPRARK
jgi:predicted aspartyl protease